MRRLHPVVLVFLAAFLRVAPASSDASNGEGLSMQLTSSAFVSGESIPVVHTCKGADVSPPLAWTGAPAATRSFALVVVDPDAPDPAAPRRTWVHWVAYNLPPGTTSLPQGVGAMSPPSRDGVNDWGREGYGGPCPPIGRHRYFFRLFALDVELPVLADPGRTELEKAMKGHVLATAELMGTFAK